LFSGWGLVRDFPERNKLDNREEIWPLAGVTLD
jgi:hypothetical protein